MSISELGLKFFEACEKGKGWEECKAFATSDATFEAQAEPLAGIKTLEGYTNWMQGLLKFVPDGRYTIKTWGIDQEKRHVIAYAVFEGTHTGEGGPCPPTGKTTKSDYVYVLQFNAENKIVHLQKVWHAGLAMKEFGWA